MARPVLVSHTLNSSSKFAAAVQAAAAKQAVKKLNAVREDVIIEANRIISTELVADSNPKQRKRGRHLLGSIDCEVDTTSGGFPVTLTARARGVNQGKVGALEWGSLKGHEIRAVNAERLAFTSTKATATEIGRGGSVVRLNTTSRPGSRARVQAYGRKGGGIARPVSVWHPGNKAYHFMQRALQRAIRNAFR